MDNKDELQEFNLDQMMKDFQDIQLDEDITAELPVASPEELLAIPSADPEVSADEAEISSEPISDLEGQEVLSEFHTPDMSDDILAVSIEDAEVTQRFEQLSADITTEIPDIEITAVLPDVEGTGDELMGNTVVFEEASLPEEPHSEDPTLTFVPTMDENDEAPQDTEDAPASEPIPLSRSAKLRDLKKKLVAGPEKRYYDLSEVGVTKLQLGIFFNILIFLLCIAAVTCYTLGIVTDHRMKLMIFSQVLAMLVSALVGSHLLIDGVVDLLKFRFSLNSTLVVSFLACCADAWFCLDERRVPCCAGFVLSMTMAMLARYHKRSTEIMQMDTMRKAVRLTSLVKEPAYHEKFTGILRGQGDVDDFMQTYSRASGPEIVQRVFAFIALIASIGIAVLSGLLHGTSMAVQIFATSLMVSVPASYFIALTRPAALLQKRLHMVGSVICGWQGVKKLCGKAVFPLRDKDLFPHGSTKLNGIKFYSERTPDVVVSYTSSLIIAAGGGLVPLFRNLLVSRNGTEYAVENFHDYGSGGIGGEIRGESVLLGGLNFLQDMGVEIPQGTTVSQAIYVAIDGQLAAVIAISYGKMRSAAAGIVSLCGHRKLRPLLLAGDFMLTDNFIRTKFSIRTRRMITPDREVRTALAAKKPNPEADVLALVTRDDLVSSVYAVTGSMALRTACRLGSFVNIFGGLLGIVIMLAIAYLGNTELLSPSHVLLYQAVWMIPGFLATEWTRSV